MDEISLTGNPFVDTGLAVIGSLAKLNNIEDLRLDHIKKVHGDGSKLVQRNSRLKVFNQIFGTNSPLFQPSYGYKKGIGPSEDNRNIYKATVAGLLDEIGRSSTGSKCWSCGKLSDFDFGAVCRKAIENNGKKVDGEKYLGRDWFPLAGSLGMTLRHCLRLPNHRIYVLSVFLPYSICRLDRSSLKVCRLSSSAPPLICGTN